MKALSLILLLAFATQAAPDFTAEEQAREQVAISELDTLKTRLSQARTKLATAQVENKRLTVRFDTNEKQRTELDKEWQLASSDMAELFAVSRQGAKDAMALLEGSAVQAQLADRLLSLKALGDEKAVPDRDTLALLPALLLEEMRASAQIARFQVKVLGQDGVAMMQPLTRFGTFSLATEQDLVRVTPQGLQPVANLPGNIIGTYDAYQGAEGEAVAIDPSHGELLAMMTEQPTFTQRLQQGGIVGYIILTLAIIGISIAGGRLIRLSQELKAVRRQASEPTISDDNALGRLLMVAKQSPCVPMERLGLRLDEAIMQETLYLDRGISMIKVIATIAPMLGLLGTVVGMIGTFQVITQFGVGDPKIMAGGISMALVTTVLGLVTAIPLVFAHSLLQSHFGELSNLLELQVAGILAERAEGDCNMQSKPEPVA